MPPEPKPGDLDNPVPNSQPPSLDFSDFTKNLPKASEPPSQASSAPPLDFNAFSAAQKPPVDQVDDNAPSAGNQGDTTQTYPKDPSVFPFGETSQQTTQASGKASDIMENVKELKTLAIANLNSDPKSQIDVWKEAFGDKNAKLIGDKIYFRSEDGGTFRPATKGLLDGFANVLASHSKDVAFTAGALATGGVLGVAGVGAEGLGVAGRIGMAAAEGAGGGVTASGADNVARDLNGLPSGSNLLSEGAKGALGGAAIGSAAEALTSGVPAAFEKVANYIGGPSKIQKILSLYKDIGDVAVKSGMNINTLSPELDSTTIGEDLAGKVYKEPGAKAGRLQDLKRDLSGRIGAVVNEADKVAGDQTFDMQDSMKKIQTVMENAGYKFKPGQMKASPEMSFDDLNSADVPREISLPSMAFKPERGDYPSGESSQAVQQKLVDSYNDLLMKSKTQGFKPSEVANTVKAWQDMADFDKDLDVKSNETKSIYRQASNAMANERDSILGKLAPKADPAIQQYFGKAYGEYSQKIQYIQDYLKDFNGKNSSADFADSLLATKNNYQKVGFLREMLGEQSPEWGNIKGNWFAKMIDKNSTEGFLDARALQSDLKSYEPRVLNQLIPSDQQAALKLSIDKLKTIDTTDFTKSPEKIDLTNFALAKLFHAPFAAGAQAVSLAHKAIFNLSRQNGPYLDQLANEGLLSMARNATDAAEKTGYLQAADALNQAKSMSQKVPDSKVGYKYVVRPEFVSAVNALWQSKAPSSQAPQQMSSEPYQRPAFHPVNR